MKKLRGVLIAILAVFLISGITLGAAKKPVVLRAMTWDSAEGSEWAKAVFDKFEKHNPDIKIELQPMPDGYDDRLLTSLAAGTPPDLFLVWDYPSLASRGGLEPLDKYDIDFSGINPSLVAWNSYKNHIYGVPKDWTTQVIWYNKKVFDRYSVPYPKTGWTWDDFRNTAKMLTHADDKVWGAALSFGDPYDWQNWFVMGGGDYLSPDGTTMKGYFDSQGAIDTMKFLTDMVLVDKVSPSPSILSASGGTYAMFSSGKLGMIHSGMWFLGYLSSRGLPADDYGTVIVPSPKGRQPVTMMNTSGWAMAAACKNKKEAVEVLKFLADEGGKTQGEAGWAFPVSEKAIKETGLLDDPVTRVFHDSLQYALESPGFLRTPDYMEKCSQYVSEAFDLVLLGKATPEEAMKQAVAKSEKAFER